MSGPLHAITMPRWGMTMTEGQVVGWLVDEGQGVSPGDEIVEIETTKITNVVEAAAAGVLRRHVIAEGVTAPVGALIGVVADAGVPDDAIDAFIADQQERHAEEVEAEGAGFAPRIVDAGGAPINVLTVGEGGGVPIVMIHGFGGDISSWMFNQEALADGRAVHAIDLPAHGESGLEVGDGSVAALASVVAAAMNAIGAMPAHLVGHSLGGAIALDLALSTPDRVASLTLISPCGLGEAINDTYIEGFLAAERRPQMKEALGLLFADAVAVRREMVQDVLRFKRMDGVPEALRVIADASFPSGRQAAVYRDRLDAIDAPIQIVWGRSDAIIPAGQADGLPETIAVHIIDDAGHMAQMEQSSTVNRLILDAIAAAEA